MDASIAAAIVSAVGGTVTVAGTVYTSVRSGKDKDDRDADRTVAQANAEKIAQERRKIAEETSDIVIARVNSELNRIKNELGDALSRAEHYREQLQLKNNEIDIQARVIRRLTRRSEALEEWIETHKDDLARLGIESLPRYILGDRLHNNGITPGEEPPSR